MDWQALKDNAWKWTQRFALFWLLQTSLVYLWACIVAGKPIGPVEYIRFQNHVIQYRPQRSATGTGPRRSAALRADICNPRSLPYWKPDNDCPKLRRIEE